MKIILKNILLLLLITNQITAQPKGYENIPRKKQNINLNWFWTKNSAESPDELLKQNLKWEKVSLPHNPDPVSIWLNNVQENWEQPTFMRDINWYKKELPIDIKEDELVFLEFEGVHTITEIWINGRYVGRHDISGYTPFHFNITPFIESNQPNEIIIKADNRLNSLIPPDPHQTDYIKWSGIYRDVYLVTTKKMHVNYNWEAKDAGVRITTPTVKKRYGTVSVSTTVVNEFSEKKNCKIVTKIVNADGLVLKTLQDNKTLYPSQAYTFKQTTGLEGEDYFTWSPSEPYLYRAVSYIYSNDELVDFVENKFGFRKLELVDGQGLLLNGEPFFMIGVNRHQSFPHIGDAVPNSLHYQEALRYKEAGINTIRLSHYPQDDAFIEACDELGILLYEEPATWINWEQGEWMERLEQTTRIMIRNHRNHPSIAIWGAGINHRGAVPRLAYAAKEEDPTRLTASASSPWNGMHHAGPTDIYATMDYRISPWAEEGFTLVMEHGNNASGSMNQFYLSRYKKRKNNIGAILWVGADYNHLKPKASNPERFTTYGMLNIYRTKRPVYYWYQTELTPGYKVHVADERVSNNGIIHVYSNADRVELYANGKMIGSQRPDNIQEKKNLSHPSFSFYYNWKGETLLAKAYKGNKLVATHERKMPGRPYKLKLEIDYPEFPLKSGGSDIKIVRALVLDKNGSLVTNADLTVNLKVSGNGYLVQGDSSYVKNMQTMDGIATFYIKGTNEPGEIKLKAVADNLKPGVLSFKSVKFNSDEILSSAKDIFDFPIYRIDIGGKNQLIQFDWEAWNITKKEDLSFKNKEGILFSISSPKEIEWTKGQPTMLGDLCFMGADGVFVKDTTLTLSIKGLQPGIYKIISYHHARLHKDQFPYNVNNSTAGFADTWQTTDQHLVGYFNNDDTGERAPISFTQIFKVSKESETVNLDFFVDKPNSFIWLNGFELRRLK